MADMSELTGGPTHIPRGTVARGKVIVAPATLEEALTIALINYASDWGYEVPAENWVKQGPSLPRVDDRCVIVFDDDGDTWVVGWPSDAERIVDTAQLDERIALLEARTPAPTPSARIRVGEVGQVLENTRDTILVFGSADFDTERMFALESPSRLTCVTAGLYLCGLQVSWEAGNVGARLCTLRYNEIADIARERVFNAGTSDPVEIAAIGIFRFNRGDWMSAKAYQSSGESLTVQVPTLMWWTRIGT